jgi:hypothetical protein
MKENQQVLVLISSGRIKVRLAQQAISTSLAVRGV